LKWLERKQTCPCCRASYIVDEVVDPWHLHVLLSISLLASWAQREKVGFENQTYHQTKPQSSHKVMVFCYDSSECVFWLVRKYAAHLFITKSVFSHLLRWRRENILYCVKREWNIDLGKQKKITTIFHKSLWVLLFLHRSSRLPRTIVVYVIGFARLSWCGCVSWLTWLLWHSWMRFQCIMRDSFRIGDARCTHGLKSALKWKG
jgi:hypothetical protein